MRDSAQGVGLPAPLAGIWAAVPLSWDEAFGLDEVSLEENTRRLCDAGLHGVYTTGSTGEFYALSDDEFRRIVEIVSAVCCARNVPFQVGCHAPGTHAVLERIACATEHGACAVQLSLPFWMEVTDTEALEFFGQVFHAFPSVSLVHYNTVRTKRFLGADDYRRLLSEAPSLIGVKFTAAEGHFYDLQHLTHEVPELSCFVGDEILVSGMQVGVHGCYSSIALMNPGFMLRLYALAGAHRWDEALKVQTLLVRLKREISCHMKAWGLRRIDPAIDKGLGVAAGFLAGHQRIRPPYESWSDEGVARVRQWLERSYPSLLSSAPGTEGAPLAAHAAD